jgi:hypothetical protein
MTLVIHKQIVRRLNGLSNSVDHLIDQLRSLNKNKLGLTISLKSFIDRSIKKEALLKDGLYTSKFYKKDLNKNENINYFIGNKSINAFSCSNSTSFNNYNNITDNKSITGISIYENTIRNVNKEKLIYSQVNKNTEENSILNNNSQKNDDFKKIIFEKNNISSKNFIEKSNFFEEKLLLSTEKNNEINTNRKNDSEKTNKMFSVSKKINNPFSHDNDIDDDDDDDEEEISISDEDEEEISYNEISIDLNSFQEKNFFNKKLNNISSDLTKLSENIEKNRINIKSNNILQSENEKFTFKENFEKNGPKIMVNNINNINNINIVSNDIGNIKHFNNLIQTNATYKFNSKLDINSAKKDLLKNKNDKDLTNGINLFKFIF